MSSVRTSATCCQQGLEALTPPAGADSSVRGAATEDLRDFERAYTPVEHHRRAAVDAGSLAFT